jgi:hypothetical protein
VLVFDVSYILFERSYILFRGRTYFERSYVFLRSRIYFFRGRICLKSKTGTGIRDASHFQEHSNFFRQGQYAKNTKDVYRQLLVPFNSQLTLVRISGRKLIQGLCQNNKQ